MCVGVTNENRSQTTGGELNFFVILHTTLLTNGFLTDERRCFHGVTSKGIEAPAMRFHGAMSAVSALFAAASHPKVGRVLAA